MPTFRPNMELIEDLIRLHPDCPSKIFRDMGMADGTRTLNNWRRGKKATEDSLERFANFFERTFGELILVEPVKPKVTEELTDRMRFRRHIVSMINADDFRKKQAECGDIAGVDILDFAYGPRRDEIKAFNLGLVEEETELFELERQGMVYSERTPEGRNVFYSINWTLEAIKDAYEVRGDNDRSDAKRAIMLQETDPKLYKFIRDSLHSDITELQLETEKVMEEPTIENALKVLEKDCDCHMDLCLGSQCRTARTEVVIAHHLRPFYHLLNLHRIIGDRGITLPSDIKSIPELVGSFHSDWIEIFLGFTVVDPQDDKAMGDWLDVVADHPRQNFEQIKKCHQLIETAGTNRGARE